MNDKGRATPELVEKARAWHDAMLKKRYGDSGVLSGGGERRISLKEMADFAAEQVRELTAERDRLKTDSEHNDLRFSRIVALTESLEESLMESGDDAAQLETVGYILAFAKKEVAADELLAS